MRHTHIPFQSESEFDLQGQLPNNFSFNLNLWLPDTHEPCNDFVILINGFLEGDAKSYDQLDKHLWRYTQIAEELTSDGKAVVLMPLPFHFQRGIMAGQNEGSLPLRRLKLDGSWLYHGGYTQVILDIRKLVDLVLNNPSAFNCTNYPRLHLVGYSIGGVGVLGAATELAKEQRTKLESVSVLLSAWRLVNINPGSLETLFKAKFGLTAEDWQSMVATIAEQRLNGNLDDVFTALFFGDDNTTIDVSQIAKKVLFVHGMKDEIFELPITENLRSDLLKPNCTLITLPTNHIAIRQNKQVAKYIATFIGN